MGYGGCTICNEGSPLLDEETRELVNATTTATVTKTSLKK